MNPVQQGVLAALVVAAGMAVSPARVTPRFEDYPSLAVFRRTGAELVFDRVDGPALREKIEQSLRDAMPNFASHFTVVEWECGANCRGGAMVDAESGHLYALPAPPGRETAHREYRLRSSLMVVKTNCAADAVERCDRDYYTWSNGEFREVYRDSTRQY